MKNERYYYRSLTAEEKTAYRMIYDGIKLQALNIIVPVCLTPEQMQDIYLKVLFDTPWFYYINQTVIRMTGQAGHYVLLPEYLYTGAEIKKLDQEIQNVLHKIDIKARQLQSDQFRLEKFLHDSVVRSVAYDYDALRKTDCFNAHSIVGAFLDKKAVCEGIAKAFKLLCNEYAIKCIVVVGKAEPSGDFSGEAYHAWNLAKIGSSSYHVDVTWDNLFETETKLISYDYFNVTTEAILKDHRPLGKLPVCTDTALNYFYRTKSFVSTYQDLVDLILQRFHARQIMFRVLPESVDLEDVKTLKAKTLSALSHVMALKNANRKMMVSFNETQRIGKIIFL